MTTDAKKLALTREEDKVYRGIGAFLLVSILSLLGYAIYRFVNPNTCNSFDMSALREITDQVIADRGLIPKGAVWCNQPTYWQKEYYTGFEGKRYFLPIK